MSLYLFYFLSFINFNQKIYKSYLYVIPTFLHTYVILLYTFTTFIRLLVKNIKKKKKCTIIELNLTRMIMSIP